MLKLQMMMLLGASGLMSATVARAQMPDATPQPPPAEAPPPIPQSPSTIPDIDQPVPPVTVPQPTEMSPVSPPTPTPVVEEQPYGYPRWMSRVGAAMMLGGGYEDFTYNNIKAMTGAGGSWDARVVAGTRQFIGLEAAYVGAARSIQTLGLATNTNLVSNGAEGAVRVNIPIVQGAALVEPFGFVGLGWQHYSLTNASQNTSDLTGSDDVMTVPYGGGVEASYKRLMLDARFTYRQTYMNDLLRAEGGRLNTWGVGGNVGVEF